MAFPDALAVSITTANGTEYRWGGDEESGLNVPQGISFGTAVPGGFTTCSLSLPRRIDKDFPDLNLFDDVTVYGPGGEVAWQGRVAQLPRTHGSDFSVTVGCVGWSAHLKDDPSFKEIYVDRDLSNWTGAATQRRINIAAGGFSNVDASVVSDTTNGAPSLAQTISNGIWAAGGLPTVDSWYDAHGISIGSVYYAWKKNANVDNTNVNWSWKVYVSADDAAGTISGTAELRAAGPGTGTLSAPAAGYPYALIALLFAAAGGAANTEYSLFWTCLAVYGNHGLTKQGTASATAAQGFYASDVVANIVGRAAPLLTYTTGTGGTIESTTFVIPHLAFRDPTTAEDALLATNAYHLWEWGVYENKTFFYRAPNPDRLTWEARLSNGAQLDLEGDSGDNVFNGVYVKYQDPSGTTYTVGPPGSGANATDSSLQDTSATNPLNSHGIPKRWGILEISQITTSAAAIQLGAVWLAEQALPQRRGSVVITGTATHPTAGDRPVWAIRAGDYISIPDYPNTVARRVIETSYSHDTNQMTCQLDNSSTKLNAILERIGVVLTGVI